jgi:acyl-CoA synthetase (AMP-forming)/AMP-acid ligase II
VLTIGELLRRSAKARPNKTALIFEENTFTFKELNDVVNKFANALANSGVKKGDRVGVISTNNHYIAISYFAVAKVGAILVPVSFWYKEPDVKYCVAKAGISTFIIGEDFVDMIQGMKDKLPTVERYIAIGRKGEEGMLEFDQLISESSDAEPNIEVDENEAHLMLFTSGTTGVPKGAVQSHRSYYLHAMVVNQAFNMREESVYLLIYPMFHMGGIQSLSQMAQVGSTLVIVSTPPTPEKILEAIDRHKVTGLAMVPTMWRRLLAHPDFDKYDVSSLEFAMGASDGMPLELLEELMSKTGCSDSPQLYGLTEGGDVTFLPLKDTVRKLGSSGKPSSTVEIKLVDDDGQEVPEGEVGEIVVRGEHVMLGYWDMPEENSKTLVDGWLYTGDLGKFDEEGYIYIVGRKKDMIISGGQNIYPAEIERILLMHDKIKEVAVIGLPDKEWNETVMAVIVLEDGMTMTEDEVIGFIKDNTASYNKPRYVRFLSELPRTAATGKLQKAELRKAYIKELGLE